MIRPAVRSTILLLATLGWGRAAAANWLLAPIDPAMACKLAIHGAEARSTIPPQLLAAIGRVESGRRDPLTGGVAPWPWTINAEGEGHFFDTKAQAIAAVQALQARGVRSIDVGCLQVNLMHHPDAFTSLEQAFDPVSNAGYAAQFLTQLHDQLGSWPRAAAAYHSQTPGFGDDYERRVMAAWPEERQLAGNTTPLPPGLSSGGLASGGLLPGGGGFGLPVRPYPVSNGPASAGAIYAANTGGLAFNNNAPAAHIIPLAAPSAGARAIGHGLDFYRSRPIMVMTR